MLKRKSIRKTWVLGLITILCTCNLAYANVSVTEKRSPLPVPAPINPSADNRATEPAPTALTTDAPVTKEPATRKSSTNKNTAKAANACACACPINTGRSAALPDAWWNCFKGCLRSWGVSPVQLALCAGTCAFGLIPLCALCLGIDVSIALFCAIGCDVYAGGIENGDEGFEPILTKKLPLNKKQKAERRVLAFAALK